MKVILIKLLLLVSVGCSTFPNNINDYKIDAVPPIDDSRFINRSESELTDVMEVGPNYELKLLAKIKGEYDLLLPDIEVDKSGSIYVACSSNIIMKLSSNGEVQGIIKGNIPHETAGGWESYANTLLNINSKNAIIPVDKIVSDDEGYLYLYSGDEGGGCIAVCNPDFTEAVVLQDRLPYRDLIDITYNKETGGVVVISKDGCICELKKGRIIKDNLPKYYIDAYDRFYLEMMCDHATFYSLAKTYDIKKDFMLDAEFTPSMSFALDLRRRIDKVDYIGYSSDLGWCFDVALEDDYRKSNQNRMTLFVNGLGYNGHLISIKYSQEFKKFGDQPGGYYERHRKLVGQNGKYYEFLLKPNEDTLYIYKAKRIH